MFRMSMMLSVIALLSLMPLATFGIKACLEERLLTPPSIEEQFPIDYGYPSQPSCSSNEYFDYSSCVCRPIVSYGGSCTGLIGQCESSLTCLENMCDCVFSQYYDAAGSACTPKVSHGGSCTDIIGQCESSITCLNNICDCDISQYYDAAGSVCRPKVSYGGSCTDLIGQCESSLTCLNNKCDCDTSQYYDAAGSVCTPIKSKGDQCTDQEQCQSTLTCLSGKCDCTSSQYYNSACEDKKSKGVPCTDQEQCQSTLTCLSGECDCTDNQYYDSTCKDKVSYGSSCTNITGQCESSMSCQSNKCDCANTQYYDTAGAVCKPIDDIKVVLSPSIKRFPTQASFLWSADDHGLPVVYRMAWVSLEHSSDKGEISANNDGVVVSGLIPGREYKFTIISVLTSDNNKTAEVSYTLETLPARPGLVNLTTSELDNPPYVLRFQPSDGDVFKYKITLSDGSATQSAESHEPEVQFSELSPSTVYAYTIVATNKNGDNSDPITGSFTSGFGNGTPVDPTPSENIALIVGVVVAAVVVVTAVGVIIACVILRRRRDNSEYVNDSDSPTTISKANPWQGEPEKGPDISKPDYWSYNNRSPAGNLYDEIHEDDPDNDYETIPAQRHSYVNGYADYDDTGRYKNVSATKAGDGNNSTSEDAEYEIYANLGIGQGDDN